MRIPRPPRYRANFTPEGCQRPSYPRSCESVRIVSRYREFTTVTERIHLFHLHLLSTLMPLSSYSSPRVAGSFSFSIPNRELRAGYFDVTFAGNEPVYDKRKLRYYIGIGYERKIRMKRIL